jgi:short-subunit dehydrogenase
MTKPSFRTIVLTGATGGIGVALAERLAAPGRRLLLIGRRQAELEALAGRCRTLGAEADIAAVDVRDGPAMEKLLQAYDDAHAIDLVFANAGVSAGLAPGRQPEAAGVSRRLMEINYGGMLNTVEPLIARFIARRAGRFVLTSSVAALRPQPDLPSYSATKMAVRGYGVALRGWLREFGVGVSVVFPGFVTSPMSLRHNGAKPFEIPAARAAEIIVRGVERGRSVIAFPLPLAILAMLGMLIPPWFADWFEGGFRAHVEPDDGR